MKFIYFILCFALVIPAFAQVPNVSNGKIIRLPDMQSVEIGARHVDVWLPPGYSSTRSYDVLYMHDGQMLFDSTQTWNKQEWMVDEIMGRLIAENKIRPAIVVGIWNNGAYRHQEYFPAKPLMQIDTTLRTAIITNELKGKAMADAYLRFIVQVVKPKIDSNFYTKRDRSHTFIAGSSMGGLISMYAFCEYPEVFGGAACLSTHWIGSLQRNDPSIPTAFLQYLEQNLPSPKGRKIYFDTGDRSLDSLYPAWQAKADQVMKSRGYKASQWMSLYFPGDDHSERAWQRRLDKPLLFLLCK